jgi:hypothetical protein
VVTQYQLWICLASNGQWMLVGFFASPDEAKAEYQRAWVCNEKFIGHRVVEATVI